METSIFVEEIAEHLAVANLLCNTDGSTVSFLPLLGEIAKGDPISRERLAAMLGWPLGRFAAVRRQAVVLDFGACSRGYGDGVQSDVPR
jgi:hypothetical protein